MRPRLQVQPYLKEARELLVLPESLFIFPCRVLPQSLLNLKEPHYLFASEGSHLPITVRRSQIRFPRSGAGSLLALFLADPIKLTEKVNSEVQKAKVHQKKPVFYSPHRSERSICSATSTVGLNYCF